MLLNIVFYLKLNFKLKTDPKGCSLKNLKKFLKTWRKFAKKNLATLYNNYKDVNLL